MAPKAATQTEEQFICKAMAHDMMLKSLPKACANWDKIEVALPAELQVLNKLSADLKEKAAKLREEGGEESSNPFGGMLSAASAMGGLAGKGASLAGDLLGAAGSTLADVVDGCAKQLDDAIKSMEKPMNDVCVSVFKSDSIQIQDALKDLINKAPVPDAKALCTGSDNQAISKQVFPDYYAKLEEMEQKGGEPSEELKNLRAQRTANYTGDQPAIVKLLKEKLQKPMEDTLTLSTWQSLTSTYNDIVAQLKKVPKMEINFAPIQVDLTTHISWQAIKQLGAFFGTAEAEIRENPGNTGEFGDIFEKVFKTPKPDGWFLTANEYKTVQEGVKKNSG